MNRMGQALHHLEKNLLEYSNDDSFYQLESLLFIINAETFKESACFGGVVDKNFNEFSKIMRLLFRLLKYIKRVE